MTKTLTILLLIACVTIQAQNWKDPNWTNPHNLDPIPLKQQTFWEKNKKSFAITGIQLLSLSLEASGDALFDIGKRDGDKSKMQLGHTLQATGYGVLFLTLPMIDWEKPLGDGIWVAVSWGLMRYGMFDFVYNSVAGLDPLYAGTTATSDNIISQMPPSGRAITKGWSIGTSIVITFNEF